MTASYKHVGFVTKPDHMTFDEFVDAWRTRHAEMARDLPGLRRYVLNPIDRAVYPDAPADGFSELWFDSEEAAEAAWASPHGVAVYQDGADLFADMRIVNLQQVDIV